MKFMLTNNKIIVFLPQNDQFVTFPETHKSYNEVYDYLMSNPNDEQGFLELFIKIATEAIEKYSNGEIKVDNGIATIDGLPLPTDVLQKLKELKADGYDWNEQRKFWGHCLLNPRKESVADLFRFISNHNLTITEDGHFLAYKAITKDFKDKYTRTFDNSIGKVVTMNRDDVVMNPDIYCAAGLHVSNLRYASDFANRNAGDIVVLVDVNPEDVVSVPKDSNAEKIRTCAYKVLKVWDGCDQLPTSVVTIDENVNVETKLSKRAEKLKANRNAEHRIWTSVELEILNRLTSKTIDEDFDWEGVSKILGNRTAESCRRKYYRIKNSAGGFVEAINSVRTLERSNKKYAKNSPNVDVIETRNWSAAEINKLNQEVNAAREKGEVINWEKIAAAVKTRSAKACYYKWYKTCKEEGSEDKKYLKWTPKQEQRLIDKYYTGMSYDKLSKIFKTSRSSIASKIYYLRREGKIN